MELLTSASQPTLTAMPGTSGPADRLRRLEELTEALGPLLHEKDVARAVLLYGLPALGATHGSVVKLLPGGEELETLGAAGFRQDQMDRYRRFRVDLPTPHGLAVRTGKIAAFGTRAELAAFLQREPTEAVQAVISVPLYVGDKVVGSLGATFAAPRVFSPEENAFALTVGRSCAQAMERALVFAREQQARQVAEAAQWRLEVLARASQLLLAAHDEPQACRGLVELLVDAGLCEVASIDLVVGGDLQRVAAAARDPALGERASRHPAGEPKLAQRAHPVVQAVLSRAPQLAAFVEPGLREQLIADPGFRSFAEALGLRAWLAVPLVGRAEALGALLLLNPIGRERSPSDADQDPVAPGALRPQDVVLAQELAARAGAALDGAHLLAEAREAVGVRDDFLSIAGHELRTPLTALTLQLQSALRILETGGPDAAQTRRAAERTEKAARQAERLAVLIDRLLDVSRISAGRFALEPEVVDLGDLAREVCSGFTEEVQAAGGSLELSIGEGLSGRWDRLRLQQLLSNLLSNAVKYGAGNTIVVRVQRLADRARLSVRDHGLGIAPQDHARVFERFERLRPSPRTSGLGLGLWISRRIAEAHGGTLTVESEPGLGAEFRLDLPVSPTGF